MRTIRAISVGTLLLAGLVHIIHAKEAESANWAGNYTDKEFLKGQAVFQLNIIHEGGQISVDLDAVYNDGHGCAPQASAPAKVIDRNRLKFTFTDSSKNAGTGTIMRAGDDVIISINPRPGSRIPAASLSTAITCA
jgi:hypothetical protein